MWETILKRNIPEKGTSVDDIIYLITQARQLPDLELKLIDTKGKSVNEIRPIRNKMEDINSQIKGIKNKGGEGVEKEIKVLQALNIPLREEILKIERQLKKDLAKIQSALDNPAMKNNPFTPIITRRATFSENAKFSKKEIKFDESRNIIDDGYGKGQFYGKATPLTLQEAAEHYKKTVVDYDEVKVNRVMPEDKPYEGSYGRGAKDPKPLPPKDLEEAKERLSYYENIIENKRTPADKTMLVNLRSKVKELKEAIIEDAQESERVEFEAAQQNVSIKPSLSQIRTILQPISTTDFDSFIISLDEFIDNGSSPIIDKYREENPDEFTDIMALVESSSSSLDSYNDADRYLDKLTMLVYKKSIDFNKTENNNRVSLQVSDSKRYSREPDRLILPTNQDLSGKFNDISAWLAKHYEPLPDVEDKDLFIKKLVNAIDNVLDEKGGNNSIAYAIQRMINDDLASQFSRQVVVTGRYLDSNTEQQKFRQFINTKARKDMKLLENIATFLHRGNQMSSFLTQGQMDKANEMLQEQVGSKAFGRYFLAEIPSAQLQRKPKSNLAARFDAKIPKIIPAQIPDKPRSRKEIAETYERFREQQNYEPAPRGLTENQKTVLADIRETFKINKPPSKKDIEEKLKNLRQLQSETETVSDEDREIFHQELSERLGPVAMKRDGIISYEPYSARRRKFSIGGKTLEEVIAQIKTNLDNGSSSLGSFYETQVKKADLSELSTKERRKVKTMLQNAHPTEYFGEDYLRLGKVINIIDGLAEDEEAELLEKLGVKNLQMVKTAASLRKKYANLYKKLYDLVYDEEE